jgi:hypothetical protein
MGQIRYDNFVGKAIISSIDDVLSGRMRQNHEEDSDDEEIVLFDRTKLDNYDNTNLDDYDEEIVFGDEENIITFDDNEEINKFDEIGHIDTEHNLMNNEDFRSKLIEIPNKHKRDSKYDREKIKSEIGNIISIEDIHKKINEFHNKWKGNEGDNLDELGEEDDIHTKIQQYHKGRKDNNDDSEDTKNILSISPLSRKIDN